jgi:hypothetical protein
MASFTAGTTFVDGVSNDVTAAKLGALVTNATPTSGFIQDRTAETVTATNDTLLIGDASDSNNLKRITVANFAQTLPTAKVTTGTIETGTFGTTTSTAATITTGTIPTLTTGTTTSTNEVVTNGTITNLSATTSTFLGTITGSTNVVNIGSGQIYKDASGNVGVGTTSPATKLHIATSGASSIDETLRLENSSNTSSNGNKITWRNAGQTTECAFISGLREGVATSFALAIGTSPNFTSGGTNAVERLRIDSSGNVGIGTTSIAGRLDVAGGNIVNTTTATGTTGFSLSNGTAAAGLSCDFSGSNTYLDIKSKLFIRDSDSAFATRMNIDSSGNVGIGTTSPSGTLHSVSTSSSVTPGIFAITATSSTATPAVAVIKQDALNTTNQSFVLFQVGGGTNCGKINANGANTAAFGSTSDARLKENITALPSQIDNVCALRPCEFDYKDGSGHQIGFIAQEMQEVYPDSVGVGDDGMLTITAWSKTEARLVKAIQELKAKNDLLEARLEALESK